MSRIAKLNTTKDHATVSLSVSVANNLIAAYLCSALRLSEEMCLILRCLIVFDSLYLLQYPAERVTGTGSAVYAGPAAPFGGYSARITLILLCSKVV